jgi:hypothetical protein
MLLVLVSLSISTAQSAEPARTLACKGTKEIATGAKPEPISMGITIDFTTRRIEGFGSDDTFQIVITDVTEMNINFMGSNEDDPRKIISNFIMGTIDRVTGFVEAMVTARQVGSKKEVWNINYALQCKPT